MASPALRQRDLFEEQLDAGDVWADRLTGAFADNGVGRPLLPLAEEAIAACPADCELLLMAATAAVLDGRPERALVLLERFFKRGRAPAAHFLHALALDQLGRRADARALLQQQGLTSRQAVLQVFSRRFPCLPRLLAPLDEIMRARARTHVRRSDAIAKSPSTPQGGSKTRGALWHCSPSAVAAPDRDRTGCREGISAAGLAAHRGPDSLHDGDRPGVAVAGRPGRTATRMGAGSGCASASRI